MMNQPSSSHDATAPRVLRLIKRIHPRRTRNNQPFVIKECNEKINECNEKINKKATAAEALPPTTKARIIPLPSMNPTNQFNEFNKSIDQNETAAESSPPSTKFNAEPPQIIPVY